MILKFNIFMAVLFILILIFAIIGINGAEKDCKKYPKLKRIHYEERVVVIHAKRIKWILCIWVVGDLALWIFA